MCPPPTTRPLRDRYRTAATRNETKRPSSFAFRISSPSGGREFAFSNARRKPFIRLWLFLVTSFLLIDRGDCLIAHNNNKPNETHMLIRVPFKSTTHRRLNQERKGDAARGGVDGQQTNTNHVSSYAQRHQTNYKYYNGGSSATSSSSSFSSSYYNYDDDDYYDSTVHRRYHHNDTSGRFSTNLSDVWLCLLTALCWTVWMFSSFQASRHEKNHERFLSRAATEIDGTEEAAADARFHGESVLVVRGNVRDVMLSGHGDGVLPMYTAVIDYIIERGQTHESIQIRKHFDTQQALEQGFANVELLVLPEDPTESILKEDFYQQVQEERQAQLRQIERKTRRDMGQLDDSSKLEHDSDTLGDFLEGYYCKWKRVSTCFASLLVLASLAGTVQVVCLIDPEKRWMGWLSFWLGVTLLLPLALAIHNLLIACTRWHEQPEYQGFVVQISTTPTFASPDKGRPPYATTSLQEACMPPSQCGAFLRNNDRSDTTGESLDGDAPVQRRILKKETSLASHIVPEMSGCYFVHYPTNHHSKSSTRSTRHHQEVPAARMNSAFFGDCAMLPEPSAPEDGNNDSEILSTSSVSSISDQDTSEPPRRR